ncbi:MAG TPA: MlaD family protein [Solirubrobacteraceae bacterium]|nr:MlaD family protein [Solirubrobacteraceae bacterium]
MKSAIRRRLGALIAVVALAAVGIGCAAYIIGHQNAEFPSWIPIVGDDSFVVHAEMATAQGITPGQGQPVEIAGVVVGRVSAVDLRSGRADLTLHLDRKYAKLYANAGALLRPRTLLKDMILAVSPGTPAAGPLREGATIPVSNTLPDVNVDEILSALDADTRAALVSLAQGAGQGLGGQGKELSGFFHRLDPTTRKLRQINGALVGRRRELARAVHAFSQISTVLGENQDVLTDFVTSSDTVFASLAAEQDSLRRSLAQLPSTLSDTRRTTRNLTPVLGSLRSASQKLLPGARALQPGLTALTPFFEQTEPDVQKLRPLARDARTPAHQLNAATRGLEQAATDGRAALGSVNGLFNLLSYDPPGGTPSRLFWAGWAAHQLNSVVSAQDALGAYAHTLPLLTCNSLGLLPGFIAGDPPLGVMVTLANLPKQQEVCTGTAR